jgi:ATP-dependent Lhr-like helicase
MQRMELAGELVAGHFIRGLPGLQFASPEGLQLLRQLEEEPGEERVYWIGAADPASPCGLSLTDLPFELPSRLPSSFIVFRGEHPVLILLRSGGELRFRCPPEDGRIADYLRVVDELCRREVQPWSRVLVQTINGRPAAESPYRSALERFGFNAGYKGLVYRPRPGI